MNFLSCNLLWAVGFILGFMLGFGIGKQYEISDCKRYGSLRDNGKIYECKQVK